MLIALSLIAAAQADTATIILLCSASDCAGDTDDIEGYLLDAGATAVEVRYDTDNIADHRLAIVSHPYTDELWSETVRQDIIDFAKAGGLLVLVGENGQFFETANDRFNDVLHELGLGSDLQLANTFEGESGCLYPVADINSSHPLAVGVGHVNLNWHSSLDVDSADVIANNENGKPVLAGVGNVLLAGDGSFAQWGCLTVDAEEADATSGGYDTVLANFWATLDETSDDGGGEDGGDDEGEGSGSTDGGGSDDGGDEGGDEGGSGNGGGSSGPDDTGDADDTGEDGGIGLSSGSDDDDDDDGMGGCGCASADAAPAGASAAVLTPRLR